MLIIWQAQLEVRNSQGDRSKGLFAIIREKVYCFATAIHLDRCLTLIDWIFDARSYGLRIQFTTAIAGKVIWEGTTITYRSTTFSMESLSEMLHYVVQELGRTMDSLLYLKALTT